MKKKTLIMLYILLSIVLLLISILGMLIYKQKQDKKNKISNVNLIEVKVLKTNETIVIKDEDAREIANILESQKYNNDGVALNPIRYSIKYDSGETFYIQSEYGISTNKKQAYISEEQLNKLENIIINAREKVYNLPHNILLEKAIQSGYFVIDGQSNRIYNKNILDRFIKNTKIDAENRVEDRIRMVVYNVDGYPTIYDLEYKIFDETYINSKQKRVNKTGYILTTDASRNNIIPKDTITNYDIPGEYYGITLTENPGVNAVSISLSLYNEINYEKSDKTPYQDIEIARYLLDAKIINLEENVEKVNPNEVTTIDMEIPISKNNIKKVTLNQEDVYTVLNIINNLNYTSQICDKLITYNIKINTKEKDAYKIYELESLSVCETEPHIIFSTYGGKKEAILTPEQTDEIYKIIKEYFN